MAGGGGAWKVAYADFVTAMMAFFLVMWLVGQSPKVKEAIAQGFNPPATARKTNRHSNRQTKTAVINPTQEQKAMGAAAESPTSHRQRAATSRKFNPMQSATLLYFAEDAAELDAESQERLKQLVPWIAGKAQKIEIRGHSSRRPLPAGSPYRDIWDLCYARCQATSKFLQQQGIAPERMRFSQAAGFEPLSNRAEAESQAHNSRVEVALLNELVQDFDAQSQQSVEPPLAP